MDTAELLAYLNFISMLSNAGFLQERRKLFHLINGEVFYALRQWPEEYRRIFWKKPMSDQETFRLFIFMNGNGCVPEIIQKWIISSTYYTSDRRIQRRRMHQADWIGRRLELGDKDHIWFYFDIHMMLYVFLNGRLRRP